MYLSVSTCTLKIMQIEVKYANKWFKGYGRESIARLPLHPENCYVINWSCLSRKMAHFLAGLKFVVAESWVRTWPHTVIRSGVGNSPIKSTIPTSNSSANIEICSSKFLVRKSYTLGCVKGTISFNGNLDIT